MGNDEKAVEEFNSAILLDSKHNQSILSETPWKALAVMHDFAWKSNKKPLNKNDS